MKRILSYLIIFFCYSLVTNVKADDISDFQIEGMSIGDSLLDYFNEDEINNSKRNYGSNLKYYVVGIYKNIEIYDTVDIYLKSGDKNYEIKSIGGFIYMKKKECLSKRKQVSRELRDLFKNSKESKYEAVPHEYDKTGKSKIYSTVFWLKNREGDDAIRIDCNDWSKNIESKYNWGDNFSVAAVTREINSWIINGYK